MKEQSMEELETKLDNILWINEYTGDPITLKRKELLLNLIHHTNLEAVITELEKYTDNRYVDWGDGSPEYIVKRIANLKAELAKEKGEIR